MLAEHTADPGDASSPWPKPKCWDVTSSSGFALWKLNIEVGVLGRGLLVPRPSLSLLEVSAVASRGARHLLSPRPARAAAAAVALRMPKGKPMREV